ARGLAPHHRALGARGAPADRRDDRQRDAGRPRHVPRRRDGRLPHQAHPRRAPGRGVEPRAGARRGRRRRKRVSETIDRATFKGLQDTAGAEFVAELVGTYLEEAPVMLADLKSALAAGDAERFKRAAHSLKSNSNTFGALTLGSMAKALELGGLAHARGAKPDPLPELEAEFARAAAALRGLARA